MLPVWGFRAGPPHRAEADRDSRGIYRYPICESCRQRAHDDSKESNADPAILTLWTAFALFVVSGKELKNGDICV
jgi:hypothetical protein